MGTTIFWFALSAIFVDFVGYWLHRLAHRPGSPMYDAHMTHHVTNYPPGRFLSDGYQASGKDSLVVWFAPFGIIYALLVFMSGSEHTWAILAGAAVIAVLNSAFHDLSHIAGSIVWRVSAFRVMAEYHRTHHRKMGRNFGILTSAWDRIFGTRFSSRSRRRGRRRSSR
jgi:sterol desaturase/sphingolipid hydroxylase (fatty acid hydroxylase superfamily)